jgi:phage FluMu protein Com
MKGINESVGAGDSPVMPIKFRCKYCNQLMGIARRKAGTDVNCPTCNGILQVPFQDGAEGTGPAPALKEPVAQQQVFEQSDFEAYLHDDMQHQQVATAAPPQAAAAHLPGTVWNPPAPDLVDVEPAPLLTTAAPPGIVLSNGLATLLTIGIIFLMGLSFSLGLLVGRAL